MKKIVLYLTWPLVLYFAACQEPANKEQQTAAPPARSSVLQQKLDSIARSHRDVTVGVAVIHLEKGDMLLLNNDKEYPMQSVFKFPLAIAVLHQVDQAKLSLEQPVAVSKEMLRAGTWSPLREQYPEGNIKISISKLLQHTVSQSDNNACDILFGLLGGTKTVQAYLDQVGVKDMKVVYTETEMAKGWPVQYDNWTRPGAMAALLSTFYTTELLSAKSKALLLQFMTESVNTKRIRGLLPAGTVVAHKTGTSDTNEQGITAATNDVGIITLPDGGHVALAVFLRDSKMKSADNELLIATIAKAVFDHYSTPQ